MRSVGKESTGQVLRDDLFFPTGREFRIQRLHAQIRRLTAYCRKVTRVEILSLRVGASLRELLPNMRAQQCQQRPDIGPCHWQCSEAVSALHALLLTGARICIAT